VVDTLIRRQIREFEFNTEYNPNIYLVEAPDAIEPADSNAITIFRYRENNMSAAIGYRGAYNLVAMGFPFETVLNEDHRINLMKAILRFLK
jgi:hypothetical protein